MQVSGMDCEASLARVGGYLPGTDPACVRNLGVISDGAWLDLSLLVHTFRHYRKTQCRIAACINLVDEK
jgi:hypothetical protein